MTGVLIRGGDLDADRHGGGHRGNMAIHKPRREVSEDNPINTLISDFQSPELRGNKFLLLHPSHL